MRKALVIYNPAAGRFPVKPFLKAIEKELVKADWCADIVATQSGDHAVQLGKQAAAEKYEAALAVGGDGTVGQVASGLLGSETALGVLPAGTSNVWAQELGLPSFNWAYPRRLQENARILANTPIQRVDMGQCNEYSFMMWAGMGLDAMAIHTIEPRVRLEKFFAVPEYAASTIWNASQWSGIRLRLWVDEKEIEGHYLLTVANNIRRYMGGHSILSPNAYLDDGLLDLWLFQGDSLADAFRIAYELWRGHHVNSSEAQRIPFQSLRVQAESPFFVHMDAEPKDATKEANITVQKRALKLLMPPDSLHLLQNAS
ncbi:MAG: YegS/Rv2252/BmrU family lipid kinase [Anaerolineales bacterium]|nr:YegS/Rv2252/BmrU family lipid kinase [Anaerolineales bacterium]